jgi:NhaA family Na+:H+ antiporter
MVAGGMISVHGLASANHCTETAEEAVDATNMPLAATWCLAFFKRMIFGKGHPALQVLLFMCIMDGVLGLVAVWQPPSTITFANYG